MTTNADKHVARVELCHAIERALHSGFSWKEIVSVLAELAPAEPVERVQQHVREDPGSATPG